MNTTNHTKPDADGNVLGYCDLNGQFYGYDGLMLLLPNVYLAKYNVKTKQVIPVGNPRVVPKGAVIETDGGFGRQPEQLLSGIVDDKGADLAPRGSVAVMPAAHRIALLEQQMEQAKKDLAAEQDLEKSLSAEKDENAERLDAMQKERSPELQEKIAQRKAEAQAKIDANKPEEEVEG